MAKKTVAAKKRNVKVDANGQLHVHSSFNNIIVSLANSEGQIISWSSLRLTILHSGVRFFNDALTFISYFIYI